jgi:hypothetical protein
MSQHFPTRDSLRTPKNFRYLASAQKFDHAVSGGQATRFTVVLTLSVMEIALSKNVRQAFKLKRLHGLQPTILIRWNGCRIVRIHAQVKLPSC